VILLLTIIIVTFVTAGRSQGSRPLLRTPFLAALCGLLAIGYLSQRII